MYFGKLTNVLVVVLEGFIELFFLHKYTRFKLVSGLRDIFSYFEYLAG